MWKIYWKQTIQLVKQNALISTISIIGTALAIMMVMVLLLVEHINVKEMAPEINRDSMLYAKMYTERDTINTYSRSSFISPELFNNHLKNIPSAKTISIIADNKFEFGNSKITVPTKENVYGGSQMSTDANYWKIMAFDFVAGAPYTQADCDARLNKVVISESKAKEMFGNANEAMSKTIEVNFTPFQIVGVVRDVAPVFTFCSAALFTSDIYRKDGYTVLFLANDPKDFDQIKEDIRKSEKEYGISHPNYTLSFIGPYSHKYQKYNTSNIPIDETTVDRKLYLMLLVLLIIPAINLSSFSFSQIKKRVEEIGIRKSFGATRWNIVRQMLMENFITTLIGGVIGLILSYGILLWLRNWLLQIPDGGTIPPQILFSPVVFLLVFVVCFVLNILSAGLPAIITIKMKIVDALNRK